MAKKTTRKSSTKKTTKKAGARKKTPAQRIRVIDEAVHTGTIVRGDGKRVRVTVPKDDAPAPKAKAPKQPKPKAPKPAPAKRVSLLDAAATVLADAKAPMQAKSIVETVVERGLWTPGAGKTPHATLYAAMTREIATKGKDARFRKVDRGQFAAA